MESTINQESSINCGKKPTETYKIADSVVVNLGNCSTKNNDYFSFDFFSTRVGDYPTFKTSMSRDKLRGLAVFILNYLEQN